MAVVVVVERVPKSIYKTYLCARSLVCRRYRRACLYVSVKNGNWFASIRRSKPNSRKCYSPVNYRLGALKGERNTTNYYYQIATAADIDKKYRFGTSMPPPLPSVYPVVFPSIPLQCRPSARLPPTATAAFEIYARTNNDASRTGTCHQHTIMT